MIRLFKTILFITILSYSCAYITFESYQFVVEIEADYTDKFSAMTVYVKPIIYFCISMLIGLYIGNLKSKSENKLIYSNDLKTLLKTFLISMFFLISIMIISAIIIWLTFESFFNSRTNYVNGLQLVFIVIGLSQGIFASLILGNKILYIADYSKKEEYIMLIAYLYFSLFDFIYLFVASKLSETLMKMNIKSLLSKIN